MAFIEAAEKIQCPSEPFEIVHREVFIGFVVCKILFILSLDVASDSLYLVDVDHFFQE